MNKLISHLFLTALLLAVPQAARAIIIEAQVASVTGKAYVVQPGSTAKLELKPGMSLAPGSMVSTETGTVGLQLMPGAVTVVEPSSELGLEKLSYEKKSDNSLNRNVLLDLKKGSVISNLQKSGTSDFKIKTPYGVAAARGTTWKVDMAKTAVYDGTVDVAFTNGRTVRIEGGTFVEVINGEPGRTAPITQEDFDAIVKALKDAGFDVTVTPLPGGGSEVKVVTPDGKNSFNGTFNPSIYTRPDSSRNTPSNYTPPVNLD